MPLLTERLRAATARTALKPFQGRRVRSTGRELLLRVGLEDTARTLWRKLEPWNDPDHARMRALVAQLPADANCIDIGCYRGAMLAEIVRRCPRGRHIAYEPLSPYDERLARRFPTVDVRNAAVSDRSGETSFVHVRSRPAYSGFRETLYPGPEIVERIMVRTERLDDALPAGYRPALIKIDVEGAEYAVLEGALETISMHKPLVLFEHTRSSQESYGKGSADVYRLLCEVAGLEIDDLLGQGPYGVDEFAGAVAAGRRKNFVAHPPV